MWPWANTIADDAPGEVSNPDMTEEGERHVTEEEELVCKGSV